MMTISELSTDIAILKELGARLARRRIDLDLTQDALAHQAGVSKRTVERIESGESSQLANIIRILRVLELMPNLDQLIPETGPRPMELLKHKGKARQRASTKSDDVNAEDKWTWKK